MALTEPGRARVLQGGAFGAEAGVWQLRGHAVDDLLGAVVKAKGVYKERRRR